MYENLRRDFDRLSQDIRHDVFRDAVDMDLAKRFFNKHEKDLGHKAGGFIEKELPLKHQFLVDEGVELFRRREAERRCMRTIKHIVCFLLVLCGILAVAAFVCKKCSFILPKKESDSPELPDDKKALYAKLSKIKGRTSR